MEEDRPKRWISLLQVSEEELEATELKNWSGELNHPDQEKISHDCDQLHIKLPIFAEVELRETLEWLLTFFCKEKKIAYISGLHELLAPFFLIGFNSVGTLYACFNKFIHRFLPRAFVNEKSSLDYSYKLFHLLVMYHEPIICNVLDGRFLHPNKYAEKWFLTMFSSCLDISLLLAFWEFCLQEENPYIPYFFALVIVRSNREKIFMKASMPGRLQNGSGGLGGKNSLFEIFVDDINQLDNMTQEAKTLQGMTPPSFLKMAHTLTISHIQPTPLVIFNLDQALVMPIESYDASNRNKALFVIDLRTIEEFERGHFHNSFNLSRSLQLSVEEIWGVLSGFAHNYQEKFGESCHFAFCSASGQAAIHYTSTLALDISRRGIEHVAVIRGGYNPAKMTADHDTETCQRCELNRNIQHSVDKQGSGKRLSKLLSAILYTLMNREPQTDENADLSETSELSLVMVNGAFEETKSGRHNLPKGSVFHDPNPEDVIMTSQPMIENPKAMDIKTNTSHFNRPSHHHHKNGNNANHSETISTIPKTVTGTRFHDSPFSKHTNNKPSSSSSSNSKNHHNNNDKHNHSPRSDSISSQSPTSYKQNQRSSTETKNEHKSSKHIAYHKDQFKATIAELHREAKNMWTNQLAGSEMWFGDHLHVNPRAGICYAEAYFLRALLWGHRAALDDAFVQLESAESVAEQFYALTEPLIGNVMAVDLNDPQKRPHEIAAVLRMVRDLREFRWSLNALAECLIAKAGAYVLYGSYIRASMILRRSWRLYLRCEKLSYLSKKFEEMYPDVTKIYDENDWLLEENLQNAQLFGRGIFYLAMSMSPPSVIKLAKLVGMEADQALGLKLLYECINSKSRIRVAFGLLFLLFWLLIYIPEFVPGKEARYKEAAELIKFGNKHFPNSVFFRWLKSYLELKLGKIDKSLNYLEEASKLAKNIGGEFPSRYGPPRLAFERAWCYFLKRDWQRSVEFLATTIDQTHGEAHSSPRPFNLLILGIGCCMTNELARAENHFQRLIDLHIQSKSERWIQKRAQRYLSRRWFQLFPFEVMYLTDSMNGMPINWHESVYEFLESLDIDIPAAPKPRSFFSLVKQPTNGADEYATLQLLKGCLLRHMGRLKDSMRALEEVLKFEMAINEDSFVVPHAYYELGMVLARGRDWKTASTNLKNAKKIRNYDFRRSLNFKLNAAIEFIVREEKNEDEQA